MDLKWFVVAATGQKTKIPNSTVSSYLLVSPSLRSVFLANG